MFTFEQVLIEHNEIFLYVKSALDSGSDIIDSKTSIGRI